MTSLLVVSYFMSCSFPLNGHWTVNKKWVGSTLPLFVPARVEKVTRLGGGGGSNQIISKS